MFVLILLVLPSPVKIAVLYLNGKLLLSVLMVNVTGADFLGEEELLDTF